MTTNELEELFRTFPIDGVTPTTSDLEAAQGAYAKAAAYEGPSDKWRVFLAIVDARKLRVAEVLPALPPDQKRYLARWAFEAGEIELGLAVYQALLSTPGRSEVIDDNLQYLRHLVARGRLDDAWTARDRMSCGVDRGLAFLGAVAVAMGRVSEVCTRLEKRKTRLHADGNLCALSAMINLATGNRESAERDLDVARRLGVSDEAVRAELAKAFAVPPDSFVRRRESYALVCDHILRNPGASLEPTRGPSPHWFGGETFQMPRCAHCSGQVFQWFVIDLRVLPAFTELSRRFPLFPLLGCATCWMVQEFVVDPDALTVTNVVEGSAQATDSDREPLLQQPAALEPREPQELSDEEEQINQYYELMGSPPQVGGAPIWIHDPAVVLCPLCREDMTYVAAMAPTDLFYPEVYLNNGSGFQYHFACSDCRTVSVLAQFS